MSTEALVVYKKNSCQFFATVAIKLSMQVSKQPAEFL
jgi:hypothetical protein